MTLIKSTLFNLHMLGVLFYVLPMYVYALIKKFDYSSRKKKKKKKSFHSFKLELISSIVVFDALHESYLGKLICWMHILAIRLK
jgi:hypothetical protein